MLAWFVLTFVLGAIFAHLEARGKRRGFSLASALWIVPGGLVALWIVAVVTFFTPVRVTHNELSLQPLGDGRFVHVVQKSDFWGDTVTVTYKLAGRLHTALFSARTVSFDLMTDGPSSRYGLIQRTCQITGEKPWSLVALSTTTCGVNFVVPRSNLN